MTDFLPTGMLTTTADEVDEVDEDEDEDDEETESQPQPLDDRRLILKLVVHGASAAFIGTMVLLHALIVTSAAQTPCRRY